MSGEILLPEGDIWPVSGNIDYALLLMLQLFTHDFRVNDRVVYPALGIDMATRRKNQNLPNVESKSIRQYRYTNKGLAMELLVGMVLTHLDTPQMVRNWCKSPGGLPRSHALPGKVDVEASYAPDDGSPPFRLIAEVSAKRRVSPGFLKKQLAQAHRHAMEMVKDDVGGKVYVLVINGWQCDRCPQTRRCVPRACACERATQQRSSGVRGANQRAGARRSPANAHRGNVPRANQLLAHNIRLDTAKAIPHTFFLIADAAGESRQVGEDLGGGGA